MKMEASVDKLSREDLYSLEKYHEMRPQFRAEVMQHKRNRVVQVGPAVSLHFEDRKTMQYQIQEMLRVEKIFDAEGIQEELDSYNPLIPDGSNWKATMMVEYPDVDERKVQLSKLIGIERKTYVQVEGHDKVYPIANEDLERETDDKTSWSNFRLPGSARVVAHLRKGKLLETLELLDLHAGDHLYIMVTPADLHDLDRLFVPKDEVPERLTERSVFGEFALNGDAQLGAVGMAYGAPVPPERQGETLEVYLRRELQAEPVVGDAVDLGPMRLVIREMDGARITRVGLKLLKPS